jgi:hypothetical protein
MGQGFEVWFDSCEPFAPVGGDVVDLERFCEAAEVDDRHGYLWNKHQNGLDARRHTLASLLLAGTTHRPRGPRSTAGAGGLGASG